MALQSPVVCGVDTKSMIWIIWWHYPWVLQFCDSTILKEDISNESDGTKREFWRALDLSFMPKLLMNSINSVNLHLRLSCNGKSIKYVCSRRSLTKSLKSRNGSDTVLDILQNDLTLLEDRHTFSHVYGMPFVKISTISARSLVSIPCCIPARLSSKKESPAPRNLALPQDRHSLPKVYLHRGKPLKINMGFLVSTSTACGGAHQIRACNGLDSASI